MVRLLVLAVAVLALTVSVSAPGYAAALRSGDILALTSGGAVLRIDPVTGSQTVAATGGLMINPTGMAVSHLGDVFVVQSGDTVLKISPVTGEQNVLSTGGLLLSSVDIALDRNGDLFLGSVVETCAPVIGFWRSIIRVDPTTGEQSNATATCAEFTFPAELDPVWVNGTILVRDANHNGSFGMIMLFDPRTGASSVLTGCPPPYLWPLQVAVAPDGHFFLRCAGSD
jgi:hypothetical protein